MRPLAKLVLFAVVLLAAFGGGAALGAAAPDLGPKQPARQHETSHP